MKSAIGEGKSSKLLTYFFLLTVRNSTLKLVTKCKIKCYCSYYNLRLEFLFIHRFSSFGVILCLRGFFLGSQLLNISRKLVLFECIVP